jgi:GNAT superfamily N-acetyltransferase
MIYNDQVATRTQPSVRIATVDDRPTVVATVVAAFVDDPAFRFFFPDDAQYPKQGTAFVQYLFDKRVGHNTVWVTENCEGAALWSPPGNDPHVSVNADVARLQTEMFAAIGSDAANRLHLYDKAVNGSMPDNEPYWYLGVLGTHPEHHGRGFGAAVMHAGITNARSRNGVSYLETTNPNNVGYYERNGWKVTRVIEPTSDEMPITVWILRAE